MDQQKFTEKKAMYDDPPIYQDVFPNSSESMSSTNDISNVPNVQNGLFDVTQFFMVPFKKQNCINAKWGEVEAVRMCQLICTETGTQIVMNLLQDQSITFVVCGKRHQVSEARRRILSTFQSQAKLTKASTPLPTPNSKFTVNKLTNSSIKAKANKENKPSPKPSNVSVKPKLALATNTIENKNQKSLSSKSTSKSVANTKLVAATKPVAEKNTVDLGKLIELPKPNKWDLKGCLAYKSEELRVLKECYSVLSKKFEDAIKVIAEMKKDKRDYMLKVENLDKERLTMDEKIKEVIHEQQFLAGKVQALDVLQERHAVQAELLLEKEERLEELERVLESQERVIDEIVSSLDEVQSTLQKLGQFDQIRNTLYDTIRNRVGKILLLCHERHEDKELSTITFLEDTIVEVARVEDPEGSCCKESKVEVFVDEA